jgi:hypothetical protein
MIISVIATIAIIIGFVLIGRSNSQKIQTVLVEVDYFDHWNATVTVNGISEEYTYYSKDTIVLNRVGSDIWKISILCSKKDGSNGSLIVSILQLDGTIIKRVQTDTPFGTAKIDIEL